MSYLIIREAISIRQIIIFDLGNTLTPNSIHLKGRKGVRVNWYTVAAKGSRLNTETVCTHERIEWP